MLCSWAVHWCSFCFTALQDDVFWGLLSLFRKLGTASASCRARVQSLLVQHRARRLQLQGICESESGGAMTRLTLLLVGELEKAKQKTLCVGFSCTLSSVSQQRPKSCFQGQDVPSTGVQAFYRAVEGCYLKLAFCPGKADTSSVLGLFPKLSMIVYLVGSY